MEVPATVSRITIPTLTTCFLLGGISFFSNRYGWTCDNILAYEQVLPNGSTISVTKSSYPALYRALRGAGSTGFGITTAITLATFSYPTPPFWGGVKTYPWTERRAVIELDYAYNTRTLRKDPDVAHWSSFAYDQPHDAYVVVSNFWLTSDHDPTPAWPPVFKAYDALPSIPNTTAQYVIPMSQHTLLLASGTPKGKRNLFATFCYRPSVELEAKVVELYHTEIEAVKGQIPDFQPVITTQPISKNMIAAMAKRGGNALNLNVDGPLVLWLLTYSWDSSQYDQAATESLGRVLKLAEKAAKEMGVWNRYKYLNYGWTGQEQEIFDGFGRDGLRALKRVQKEVDPKRIFVKGGLGGGGYRVN